MDLKLIIAIMGTSITLLSLGFAIWQWQKSIKLKEIHIQNLRALWDLVRSYAPFSVTTEQLKKQTENIKIISRIERGHIALSIIFREITPMYIQAIKKDITYKFIKTMIISGEIGSTWTLRLVLMEMDPKKRDPNEEKECLKLLTESTEDLYEKRLKINKAASKFFNSIDGLPEISQKDLEQSSIEPDDQKMDTDNIS